ncbi:hypothetical protein Vadar_019705 [Vaccinium darrowii]|uniref:Uncharacterized protein n=1 Tax=Vaccinium darrowii TaxID=229202 RepID=A0ACB7X278_9ERIC|nr:hypothetical protein Vadar_019705 [Vaccinium darrowii]
MEACARTSSLETVYLLHLFWPASGKTNPATKDKDSTIEAGKDIAFANKDTLIAGGPLVLPLTRKNKMSGYVAQLRRVGKRHGVWHFNQMLLHEEAQIAARCLHSSDLLLLLSTRAILYSDFAGDRTDKIWKGEAHAEIKALRLSERFRDKAVEEGLGDHLKD